MKGQTEILEEVLVFALSFIILINLFVIFVRVGRISSSMLGKAALTYIAEISASSSTKAILANGSSLFSLPTRIGKRPYEIRGADYRIYAYDGKEWGEANMYGLLAPFSHNFREMSAYPYKTARVSGTSFSITRNI